MCDGAFISFRWWNFIKKRNRFYVTSTLAESNLRKLPKYDGRITSDLRNGLTGLQTLFSRKSSLIDAGTGFISSDSRRWYWILLTAFLSNWKNFSVSKRLQFLLTVRSELRISYRLRRSSEQLVRSDSLVDMSSTLINSSIFLPLKDFLVWFLFEPL